MLVVMKCPSCQAIAFSAQERCPACHLTLHQLDLKFGALPRHTRFVTDSTGQLSRREIAEMRTLLGLFHKKFPQSHFSVFLTNQMSVGTVAEYAFWLMNRAWLGFTQAIGADNFDLLLVIDIPARTAALIIGYGLEHYVTERDLERALAQASGGFHLGNFADGIRHCVEFMTNRMRDIVKKLEEPDSPEEASPGAVNQS